MIQTYVRRRPDRHWYGREPNGRVLDMGCGKGGDIAKWDKASIQEYVGCGTLVRDRPETLLIIRLLDVAEGSIKDFRERLKSRRALKYRAELFVLDCFRVSISWH